MNHEPKSPTIRANSMLVAADLALAESIALLTGEDLTQHLQDAEDLELRLLDLEERLAEVKRIVSAAASGTTVPSEEREQALREVMEQPYTSELEEDERPDLSKGTI